MMTIALSCPDPGGSEALLDAGALQLRMLDKDLTSAEKLFKLFTKGNDKHYPVLIYSFFFLCDVIVNIVLFLISKSGCLIAKSRHVVLTVLRVTKN